MKFEIAAALATTLLATSAFAQTPKLATDEMMVKSPDPGIEIYVRNKRPTDITSFRPERTLLYVHGATYPASTAFDLPLDGQSWMDYIAARGYDVYLLDIRGYGKSSRPKEMSEDPKANPPIVRGDAAIKDIGTVVDFILSRRNIPRLNLMGWSWGTVTMATYSTQKPNKVERLVLYAPGWIRQTPSLTGPQAGAGPLGAYRTVTREMAIQRWMTGVPEGKKATLIPAGWFDAWADATWATDPVGAKTSPPVIRAPNGVLADSNEYWSAGKAYYDPAKITVRERKNLLRLQRSYLDSGRSRCPSDLSKSTEVRLPENTDISTDYKFRTKSRKYRALEKNARRERILDRSAGPVVQRFAD